jgi:rubrerythrin
MIKQITNWTDLTAALEAAGEKLYTCMECGHVWVMRNDQPPQRCPRRDCRVWANGQKRDAPGRPPSTCPKCGAPDPKHPRKPCLGGTPHEFHA